MKFQSKNDLDVPIETVFAMLTDFERHERSALRRGAEVKRVDTLGEPAVGAKWEITAQFRGKKRQIDLEVTTLDAPNEMGLLARMQGLDSAVDIQLVALSKKRTRLNVTAELSAQTLSARLLLQSLKLGKGSISKRLNGRLSNLARDMEDRASKTKRA